ncbi:valacyclovir hydrolase isoform X2 [Homalodisca vitripennis]|uniref:valacyclovir hydrolase isoform X2 n=1 Tax=Homalodisca vitripennis TaxID=197043 RepID=UPI001EE9EC10|nr:valacyclovir hydrolase isoform X2 [Homalodisca vitripennis]
MSCCSRVAITAMRIFCSNNDQTTKVDKYTINHAVVGNGKHTILLLPGAMGTMQSDFAPQFSGLDKTKYTLVSWDPIGYGKSRPPEREYIPDFYVNDAEVLAKLMKEDVDIYESLKDISKWTPQLRSKLEAVYGAEYLERLWSNYCQYFINLLSSQNGEVCQRFLPQVLCPTLVLHGELDPLVPVYHGKFVADNIPNAKFHLVEKGKHNFHIKFADVINSKIDQFLSEK